MRSPVVVRGHVDHDSPGDEDEVAERQVPAHAPGGDRAREDPQSAVQAVDTLLHSPEIPNDAGLRIRTGAESQLTIEIAPEPAPDDQVIEEGGARVFVDS